MSRPLACEVHTQALRDNLRAVRNIASARRIVAVVKDDGYGHGLVRVASALNGLADAFAVVRAQDAVAIRQAGIGGGDGGNKPPVILLNGMFSPNDSGAVCDSGAWVVVHEARQLEWLARLPASASPVVFAKVNTGMNRLGFAPDEFASVRGAIENSGRRVVLTTHFASADSPDGLQAPMRVVAGLQAGAAKGLESSLGNSAATLLHRPPDDWARVGVALYGASPAPEWKSRDELSLRAAMTLRTELLSVRTLRTGDKVGYGGEFVASEPTPVGIAAGGYGDGLPRLTRGWVRVFAKGGTGGTNGDGVKANIIGRVSMDLLALDLRGCPDARAGDEAVLWGESPSADEAAEGAGMIAYELFSRLRVER